MGSHWPGALERVCPPLDTHHVRTSGEGTSEFVNPEDHAVS